MIEDKIENIEREVNKINSLLEALVEVLGYEIKRENEYQVELLPKPKEENDNNK
jgi:hypothetical protein